MEKMIMSKKNGVIMISILCIAACIGDLLLLYILGMKFPGYNQATDTISNLGGTASPVSNLASAWWIILGIVFIAFAAGFYAEFREKGNNAAIAGILIAIYGIGEGLGSGLFKVSHSVGTLTSATIIHDAVGGIGIVAVLIMPLVIRRVFSRKEHHLFYIFSGVIFYIGILSSILFLARYTGDNILHRYTGIWQRMTLINTYIYFVVVSIMMIRANLPGGDSR
jgi:hypothetical protein